MTKYTKKPETESSIRQEMQLIASLMQTLKDEWYHEYSLRSWPELGKLQDEIFYFLMSKIKERT